MNQSKTEASYLDFPPSTLHQGEIQRQNLDKGRNDYIFYPQRAT